MGDEDGGGCSVVGVPGELIEVTAGYGQAKVDTA
jgi:hypothetical protein